MRILFLGILFEKSKESELIRLSSVAVQNQINTFQWSVINGIEENCRDATDIINVLPVGTFPKAYKKLYLNSRQWSHSPTAENYEVGSLNLPLFKQHARMKKTARLLRKWDARYKNENRMILIYSMYEPFLTALKKAQVTCEKILIVPDLPDFFYDEKISKFSSKLREANTRKIYRTLDCIDKYVLFTKQMIEKLPVKPFIVVEGIVTNQANNATVKPVGSEKRIIMYSGSYHIRFGIKNLVDAFMQTTNENYELWLCGKGEATQYIEDKIKEDKRIINYGFISKDEVQRLQSLATVLVNPRQNTGEYVKYSFPSKTMEYLASGKPVLMYKLDGIPTEYDSFLQYVNGNAVPDFKKAIENILSLRFDQLDEIGNNGKNFVLNEKCEKVQAEKILNFAQ